MWVHVTNRQLGTSLHPRRCSCSSKAPLIPFAQRKQHLFLVLFRGSFVVLPLTWSPIRTRPAGMSLNFPFFTLSLFSRHPGSRSHAHLGFAVSLASAPVPLRAISSQSRRLVRNLDSLFAVSFVRALRAHCLELGAVALPLRSPFRPRRAGFSLSLNHHNLDCHQHHSPPCFRSSSHALYSWCL